MPNLDYGIIGLILGIIAIGIAIVAFLRQESWNKRVERMTREMHDYNQHHKQIDDAIKHDSILGIKIFSKNAKRWLDLAITELNKQPTNEKLADLLYQVGFQKVLLLNSQEILRNASNLKFLDYSLYKDTEKVSMRLSHLSELGELQQIHEYYKTWEGLAQKCISEINAILTKFQDEVKSDVD